MVHEGKAGVRVGVGEAGIPEVLKHERNRRFIAGEVSHQFIEKDRGPFKHVPVIPSICPGEHLCRVIIAEVIDCIACVKAGGPLELETQGDNVILMRAEGKKWRFKTDGSFTATDGDLSCSPGVRHGFAASLFPLPFFHHLQPA